MNENTELKTIGYTPFNYSADRALFRVNGGFPIQEALERASDLCFLYLGRPLVSFIAQSPADAPTAAPPASSPYESQNCSGCHSPPATSAAAR